ncbi:MAG TPA: molybdopterin-binding oxidoreductase, partial [Streptomyces sp.]
MSTPPLSTPSPTDRLFACLAGAVSGFAALAVAELVAVAVRPEAGPVTAVGDSTIDLTPAPVKEWAIRTFGESDKTVLQIGIVVVLAVVAVLLGRWELWRRGAGAAGLMAFGVVGAVAAAT